MTVGGKNSLYVFDLKDKKETALGEADGFEISADHKKMSVKKGAAYYVIDLPSAKLDLKDASQLS